MTHRFVVNRGFVEFRTVCDVDADEEFVYDYGPGYWATRAVLAPKSPRRKGRRR